MSGGFRSTAGGYIRWVSEQGVGLKEDECQQRDKTERRIASWRTLLRPGRVAPTLALRMQRRQSEVLELTVVLPQGIGSEGSRVPLLARLVKG